MTIWQALKMAWYVIRFRKEGIVLIGGIEHGGIEVGPEGLHQGGVENKFGVILGCSHTCDHAMQVLARVALDMRSGNEEG